MGVRMSCEQSMLVISMDALLAPASTTQQCAHMCTAGACRVHDQHAPAPLVVSFVLSVSYTVKYTCGDTGGSCMPVAGVAAALEAVSGMRRACSAS
jgi:hypothetical protein